MLFICTQYLHCHNIGVFNLNYLVNFFLTVCRAYFQRTFERLSSPFPEASQPIKGARSIVCRKCFGSDRKVIGHFGSINGYLAQYS